MHLVFLGQSGFFPVLHRFQTAHNVELVPNGCIVFLAQLHKGLFHYLTIEVDLIAVSLLRFLPFVAVVVGQKEQGTVRIDALDDLNEFIILSLKGVFLKVLLRSVVDTNAKNDKVGTDEFEVALEVVATKV